MNLVPIKVFKREPTTTDVKFRIGSLAIIGKDPTTGTEGELWYLSDFNASGEAVWLQLLTGAGSPGVDSITTDSGAPAVEPDGVGNINLIGGTGVTVTGTGPGNTATIDFTGSSLTWEVVSAATKAMAINYGYFANRAGLVTFTLPAVAALGSRFIVNSLTVQGWRINQNAGQDIRIGNQITTNGIAGYLESTAIGDSIEIVCSVANTAFNVISSIGNITVA